MKWSHWFIESVFRGVSPSRYWFGRFVPHCFVDHTSLCSCLAHPIVCCLPHWPVCSYSASLSSLWFRTGRTSLWSCLFHEFVFKASLVAPVCEVLIGFVGYSNGKSQKPLYSKLENYSKTQDKSLTSILRLLPSYTSTKVVSGVSSKGRAFYIWWIQWRNLLMINS